MNERSFVRKKVKSLTLGEKLKNLRTDRRLRARDLSRRINVKVEYIEALERGDYDSLPNKVYTKGFVRSWARFFGVPEDALLELFDREYNVYQNINYKDVSEDTVNKLPKVPRIVFTPRIIMGFVGLFVLGVIGIYLYVSVGNFVKSPWIIIEEPLNNITVNDNKITVKGKTRDNSQVFINGQQVFVDLDGSFSDEIELRDGINNIQIKSINKFNKENTVERIVTANLPKQEIVQPQKSLHLIVKASKIPVWINVMADGNEVYNDTLKKDEEKKIDAGKEIIITTSSGVHTLISADDGKTFEAISDKNEIVRDWKYSGDEQKKDTTNIEEVIDERDN